MTGECSASRSAPIEGSQPSYTEKICMSSMPSANEERKCRRRRASCRGGPGQRLRQTAETMPMPMPKRTDQPMLASVSSYSVGRKRSEISWLTGRLLRNGTSHPGGRAPGNDELDAKVVETEILANRSRSPRWLQGQRRDGPGSRRQHIMQKGRPARRDEQCRDQSQQAFENVIEHLFSIVGRAAGKPRPPGKALT